MMQLFVRTIDWIQKKPEDIWGFSIGGTAGFVAHSFYGDYVKPVIISTACAVIGLLVSHYGKKLLKWIDSKL